MMSPHSHSQNTRISWCTPVIMSKLRKIAIVFLPLAILQVCLGNAAYARDGGFPYERSGFNDAMAGFGKGYIATHISDFGRRNALSGLAPIVVTTAFKRPTNNFNGMAEQIRDR
jgi:hypothetical protein